MKLLAAATAAVLATACWKRPPNRVRAAATALRGRTVIYRATFNGGTLYLPGCQGAFVAESAFLNPPTPAIKANWRSDTPRQKGKP